MEQVIEGTWEEIKENHEAALAGHRVMVIVDPAEPPNTVRDSAHLEELLLAGINSPKHEVTPEFWQEQHRELDRRYKARKR